MSSSVIILPGISNSGPLHWQSLWEKSNPGFVRLQQRDWENPVCEEWVNTLEDAVKNVNKNSYVVLVAHSLGCLTVAHWAAKFHTKIKAALLVAVPDPSGPNFPREAVGFSFTPTNPFNFKSTVVVSKDDPYISVENSTALAQAWGSKIVNIGDRGHINAESGLGSWPEGFELLKEFLD